MVYKYSCISKLKTNFLYVIRFVANEVLTSLTSCCICKNTLFNDIILVNNIGNVCGDCFKNDHNRCTIFKNCNVIINKPLEKFLNAIELPCKYKSYGCQKKLKGNVMIQHQNTCKYRLVECPFKDYEKCSADVTEANISEHLINQHYCRNSSVTFNLENINSNMKESMFNMCNIILISERYFLIKYNFERNNMTLNYGLFELLCNEKDLIPKHIIKFIGDDEKSIQMEMETCTIDQYFENKLLNEINITNIKQLLNASRYINFTFAIDLPKSDELPKAVVDLMVCPVCKTVMRPPIYQCSLGHSICSECKTKINSCPICRGSFYGAQIRNYLAENVASLCNVRTQCSYNNCGFEDTSDKIQQHEKNCPYKTHKCAFCDLDSFIGFSGLREHLKQKHAQFYVEINEDTGLLLDQNTTKYVFIYNRLFKLTIVKKHYPIIQTQSLNNFQMFVGSKKATRSFSSISIDVIGSYFEFIPELIVENELTEMTISNKNINGQSSEIKIPKNIAEQLGFNSIPNTFYLKIKLP